MRALEKAKTLATPLAGVAWERVAFVLSAVALAYGVGFVSAHFGLPPYGTLAQAWSTASDWRAHWRSNLGLEPSRHLYAAEGRTAMFAGSSEVNRGVTLIESLFDGQVGLRLIDRNGDTVHTWPASFSSIVPEPSLISEDWLPRTDWEVYIHGSALYPNGDVLLNFGGLTLVRMNACGETLWQLPAGVHHTVYIADDGHIWTLGRRYYDESRPDLPGMEPRFRDDTILEVSPDGKILREISILGLLYRNDMIGMLFPAGQGIEGVSMTDILHANDVEVLRAEDAPAFPLFAAGDVMISLRNLNLVLVFDPATQRVKWFQTGPWLRQHDPDFHPDGRIVVFDNRDDEAGGRELGGSRLLALDPVSRQVSTIYEGSPDEPFFTAGRGAVDILDNGNFLLTESTFGRVFEITPDGEIVWSYVNRYDDDQVVAIQSAQRYPASYADFTARCPADRQVSAQQE